MQSSLTLNGPGGEARPRASRVALFALAVALVVALAALGVLLLTGTLRLGSPSATGARFASSIDARGGPVAPRNIFSGREPRIYCCLQMRAYSDTVVEARWSTRGREIGTYRVRYGRLAGGSAAAFVPAGASVSLYQDMPPGGWPEGRYEVKVKLSGRLATVAGFELSASAARRAGTDTATYRDPGGRFTVAYPLDWVAADPVSLSGALAGFMAPRSGYPPRFAVTLTDFTSASTDYLNGLLAAAGIPEAQRFTPLTINGKQAAKRTFDSQVKQGDAMVAVRTIQVVVQGTGEVLSLDCHCAAAESGELQDTFESIIASFEVK